ncbi:Ig-like domain-containing protein [Sporolactobacillus shoreicorticis]|uniref:Ig-like domain-containing protein n=1 Tax=Sporolactobacillus shoreicorticis TaxID=1923877 RepID=A0ABW5S8E6_9BACL|nr:Ig-like domain-containing protein [Sporolactobacillus shoreicorticis]MCO7128268.1 Ig-like domain-containing protein [Sporolactobacillus shoreicorticis]
MNRFMQRIVLILIALFLLVPASSAFAVARPVLISNESANGYKTENTGHFSINNNSYAKSQKLQRASYRLDSVRPLRTRTKYSPLNHSLRKKKSVKVGAGKKFWVSNLSTDKRYQVTAKLSYVGRYTKVWVNGNQLSKKDAVALGKTFDQTIFPLDKRYFGTPSDVDHNGKINLLCFDIKDDSAEQNGGFASGYFDPNDLYKGKKSNHSEIIYIDTYPSLDSNKHKKVSLAYSTLVHEFQHLINYNQNVLVEKKDEMDTWLDEGLSLAAEQLLAGKPLDDRIDYYNESRSIANGKSLLYWDNFGDNLANYSLSYLFVQYLYIQCGQPANLFKRIIQDPHNDYRAVQDVIHDSISPDMSFGHFMSNFRKALYLNQASGLYGFHGMAGFQRLKKKRYNGKSKLPKLRGGGAVIVNRMSALPNDKGVHITYSDLAERQQDRDAPKQPHIASFGDKDAKLRGDTEPGAVVTVVGPTGLLTKSTADASGHVQLAIGKQQAGTVLNAFAIDTSGNAGQARKVTVKDQTAPARPVVKRFYYTQLKIQGTAEPGARVTVWQDKKLVGTATATVRGFYSINLHKKQKKRKKLTIYAQDSAGNRSLARIVTVY